MRVFKPHCTTSINLQFPIVCRRFPFSSNLRILKALAVKEEECRNGGSREGLPNMWFWLRPAVYCKSFIVEFSHPLVVFKIYKSKPGASNSRPLTQQKRVRIILRLESLPDSTTAPLLFSFYTVNRRSVFSFRLGLVWCFFQEFDPVRSSRQVFVIYHVRRAAPSPFYTYISFMSPAVLWNYWTPLRQSLNKTWQLLYVPRVIRNTRSSVSHDSVIEASIISLYSVERLVD